MGEGKKALVRGLYAMIDSAYVHADEMAETARALTMGGARVVQLRAKGLGAADMLRAARAIRKVTDECGAVFIVNDRVDLAVLSGADGVHLGQVDLPARSARAILGEAAVIGVSTHNVAEAQGAFDDGADYVSFGPVFPTSTKGDADTPKGTVGLGEFKKKVPGIVVAIGGITEENLSGVIAAGADAVAIISDILASGDVRKKAASITARIERGQSVQGHD